MNLFTFLIRFGTGVAALLWVHVWKWAYPQSAAVVEELARKEIDLMEHGSSVWKLLRLSIDLPGIARSQQIAEDSAATRTSHPASPSTSIADEITPRLYQFRFEIPTVFAVFR